MQPQNKIAMHYLFNRLFGSSAFSLISFLCVIRSKQWIEYVTIAAVSQFKQLRSSQKKGFRGFNGIRTRGLYFRAAVL